MIKSVAVILVTIAFVVAYDNGVAHTPPMGWNSWNQFGCNIDEDMIKQTIDAMVSSGLSAVGYQYVNIDDCWSQRSGRNTTTQQLVPDPKRFPGGIKALADYAHSKNIKLGIYSDVGIKTCAGYPGSYGYYKVDADTFASWDIDYLKFDYCYTFKNITEKPWIFYGEMSDALNKTGRHILFSICNWGESKPHLWAPKIANTWRTTGDISANWKRVMEILDQNRDLWPYSTVSAWNDPDMLEVGVIRDNMQLTVGEARTHFTFWTALNSPLLLGNDLRNIAKPEYKWIVDIVANKDAIAVNQDKSARQVQLKTEHKTGTFDKDACTSNACTRTETWTRPLKGIADFAAILFNRAGLELSDSKFKKEKMTVTWTELGVSATQKLKVRDVWKGQDLGVFTSSYQTDEIAQHEAAYLLFSLA